MTSSLCVPLPGEAGSERMTGCNPESRGRSHAFHPRRWRRTRSRTRTSPSSSRASQSAPRGVPPRRYGARRGLPSCGRRRPAACATPTDPSPSSARWAPSPRASSRPGCARGPACASVPRCGTGSSATRRHARSLRATPIGGPDSRATCRCTPTRPTAPRVWRTWSRRPARSAITTSRSRTTARRCASRTEWTRPDWRPRASGSTPSTPGGMPTWALRAIEMDLTPEGAGDMDPSALARLDLVLGAFHSKLRLREDQTERYLTALANPDVHVLAHPRGRIYNFRACLSADWERVARRAAETGTALEIDAYPDRQDLDVDRLRVVAESGGWVSIGTDAHTPSELVFFEIGIAAAILAGLPRERILNYLPLRQLREWAGRIRARRHGDPAKRSVAMAGKRETIDTTPGKQGGSRYVRRDSGGRFSTDQVRAGRSVAQDRRVKAKNKAPKGMKDRGD